MDDFTNKNDDDLINETNKILEEDDEIIDVSDLKRRIAEKQREEERKEVEERMSSDYNPVQYNKYESTYVPNNYTNSYNSQEYSSYSSSSSSQGDVEFTKKVAKFMIIGFFCLFIFALIFSITLFNMVSEIDYSDDYYYDDYYYEDDYYSEDYSYDYSDSQYYDDYNYTDNYMNEDTTNSEYIDNNFNENNSNNYYQEYDSEDLNQDGYVDREEYELKYLEKAREYEKNITVKEIYNDKDNKEIYFELVNNNAYPVTFMDIKMAFYDENKKLVDVTQTSVTNCEIGKPVIVDLYYRTFFDSYEVAISADTEIQSKVEKVDVEVTSIKDTSFDDNKVYYTIKNNGDKEVYGDAYIIFYDDSNNIVKIERSYVSKLKAGKEDTFEEYVFMDDINYRRIEVDISRLHSN